MSAPGDVLAVMDDVRLAASEHHLWTAKDQAEYVAARAAVAELVEAANSAQAIVNDRAAGGRMLTSIELAGTVSTNLRAALAKFGGAG